MRRETNPPVALEKTKFDKSEDEKQNLPQEYPVGDFVHRFG
jgi:hypothetical protein